MSKVFHGKNLEIRGSHKWKGGILNFIIKALIRKIVINLL